MRKALVSISNVAKVGGVWAFASRPPRRLRATKTLNRVECKVEVPRLGSKGASQLHGNLETIGRSGRTCNQYTQKRQSTILSTGRSKKTWASVSTLAGTVACFAKSQPRPDLCRDQICTIVDLSPLSNIFRSAGQIRMHRREFIQVGCRRRFRHVLWTKSGFRFDFRADSSTEFGVRWLVSFSGEESEEITVRGVVRLGVHGSPDLLRHGLGEWRQFPGRICWDDDGGLSEEPMGKVFRHGYR